MEVERSTTTVVKKNVWYFVKEKQTYSFYINYKYNKFNHILNWYWYMPINLLFNNSFFRLLRCSAPNFFDLVELTESRDEDCKCVCVSNKLDIVNEFIGSLSSKKLNCKVTVLQSNSIVSLVGIVVKLYH